MEGDLLEANFGTGYDVAILGHILHSEGENRSRQLLKKTFRALKSGGVIAIAEWLVNDRAHRTATLARCLPVQMLVNTEKGDTFSFNEIKSWLQDAGFQEGAQARSARAFTAHSRDKALAVDLTDWPVRVESASHPRAEPAFIVPDERGKNEIGHCKTKTRSTRKMLRHIMPI